MGIGDWGLGIWGWGFWGGGAAPKPHTPNQKKQPPTPTKKKN